MAGPTVAGWDLYGLSSDFVYGNNTGGDWGAGPVDMSAATTGEYVYGEQGKWHSRISQNAYAWGIIVVALALLWLMGGLVFGDVNV